MNFAWKVASSHIAYLNPFESQKTALLEPYT